MKKTNKILARALVIILALVMITSSVVSSTFAKYVVAKSASTTVSLQKFNLKVDLAVNGTGITATPSKTGDSVIYTVTNLALKPGDNYSNLFTASITGKPTVDANVTITVDIQDCTEDLFLIDAEDFSALKWDGDRKYLPMGVYFGADYIVNPYTICTGTVEDTIEDRIAAEIKKKNNYLTSAADGVVSGKFTKDIEVTGLNNITIGFDWPKEYNTTVPNSDEIGTWISNKNTAPGFKIVYTISVVQDTSATQS